MKSTSFLFLLLITGFTYGQVNLEDIWLDYKFYPKQTKNITWIDQHHIVYIEDEEAYKIDFIPGGNQDILIPKKAFKKLKADLSKAYHLDQVKLSKHSCDANGRYILLEFNKKPIYRHSYSSYIAIWDIQTARAIILPNKKSVQYPSFSPQSNYLTFIEDNNLYNYSFSINKIKQLTKDGYKNRIINGMSDWLYEEEFSLQKAYMWDEKEENLYFLQFDESKVPTHQFQTKDGTTYSYKYPRVGDQISKSTLLCYNTKKNKTEVWASFKANNYTPKFILFEQKPMITTLNRAQNSLELIQFVAKEKRKSLYKETSETYIELPYISSYQNQIYLTSEISGYNQLYKIDKKKNLISLTQGTSPIAKIYGHNKHGFFYTKINFPDQNRYLYKTTLSGHTSIVSNELGTTTVEVPKAGDYLFSTFSSWNTPPRQSFINHSGEFISTIEQNNSTASIIKELKLPQLSNHLIENANGDTLAYQLIKPANFDSTKKYPLITNVYGGPGYQLLQNQYDPFNFFWHTSLTEKGYIIAILDPTGTGGKGKEFKNKTYKNLGQLESDDLIYFATNIGETTWVDESRLGLWGWSYGGYLSLKTLFKSDVYKSIISIAPVTDWTLYDCAYTERYNGLQKENKEGYTSSRALNNTYDLKGDLLLVHGTCDDNVHIEHSYLIQQQLIELNYQFNSFYFPYKNHGIYGGNTRYYLYQKMTTHFNHTLLR